MDIVRFEQYFDTVEALDNFVDFHKKENDLEFNWDKVKRRVWGNFPADVAAELEEQK